MIRVLIVENEPAPAAILISQLNELFPDIEILEVCETVESSLNAIKKYTPSLVFMDVELNNNEKCFDIIKLLDKIDFEIIFTTSYDKYAKQACKASALDFLEKPITNDELAAAVEKYKNRRNKSLDPKQIELLLSLYQSSTPSLKTLAIPTMEGLNFVDIEDVIYFEGASNQTTIHMSGGKKTLVSRTLKECQELVFNSNFYRIHKSYLVNLNYLKKYLKGRNGSVLLREQNIELPVSRDYKDDFLNHIGRR